MNINTPSTAKTNSVIFSAFADPQENLINLNQEKNAIQDELALLEAQGLIKKHLSRTGLDLPAYFDYLQTWKEQITIFHFGGHANHKGLRLQDVATFFEPLANELIQKNKQSLKLIFLNGCSTYTHLKTLFELSNSAVIAARIPINDAKAASFAQYFYKNLAKGDSIKEAFLSAQNFIRANQEQTQGTASMLEQPQQWQANQPSIPPTHYPFDWGLYFVEEQLLEFRLTLPTQLTPNAIHQPFANEATRALQLIEQSKLEEAFANTTTLLKRFQLYEGYHEKQIILLSGSFRHLEAHKSLIKSNKYIAEVNHLGECLIKLITEAKELLESN